MGVGVWLFWQWGSHLFETPCDLKGGLFFFVILVVEWCVKDEVGGGRVGIWLFLQWGGHLCVTPCDMKGGFFWL